MKQEIHPSGVLKVILSPLNLLDRVGARVSDRLIGFLRFFLAGAPRKVVLVVSVLALFVLSYWALPGMGYLPTGGTNLIKVQIETAEGTSRDENSRFISILEDRWARIKGVRNLVATPNRQVSRNIIFLVCDREEDSGVPIERIARQAYETSRDLPFKSVNPIQFPLFGNIDTRSNIVDVRVKGDSYSVIEPLVKRIRDLGKDVRGIVFRYTDLALRKPEIKVRVGKKTEAEIARIKVGAIDRRYAQIVDGLQQSDRIVVEGKEVLTSEQPLEITGSSAP